MSQFDYWKSYFPWESTILVFVGQWPKSTARRFIAQDLVILLSYVNLVSSFIPEPELIDQPSSNLL